MIHVRHVFSLAIRRACREASLQTACPELLYNASFIDLAAP